jgi:hypothetical protein
MKTSPRRWIVLAVVSSGLALAGQGQAPAQAPAAPPPDLSNLARQLAEQIRRLGEDIATTLEPSPTRDILIQDTQELAKSMEDFQALASKRTEPFRLRQAYAGIVGSWQHLRSRLADPGVANFAINRVVRNIDEMDNKLLQALGMNPLPPNYYGNGPVPTGLAETRRLARTLDDRAAHLLAAVQADMPNSPNRALLIQRVVDLAKATDEYYDSLARIDRSDIAQNAYTVVAAIVDQLERDLAGVALPPRVQEAWRAFAAADVLLRQNLGLPVPPAGATVKPAPAGGVPPTVLNLTDRLLGQIDAFLQAFTPIANTVPEGGYIMTDAQRLRAAAADFRRDAAEGVSTGQLAWEFRDVDVCWQRLARRINRLGRGRTDPIIQLAMRIGETCAEIHRMLGIPGYPPVLAAEAPPPVLTNPQ